MFERTHVGAHFGQHLEAPLPVIEARILSFGVARTLYKDRQPDCRSLDGVNSASHTGRRCAGCEDMNSCTSQVRVDILARRPDEDAWAGAWRLTAGQADAVLPFPPPR